MLSEPVVLMMRVLTDLFFFERTTDVSFFVSGSIVWFWLAFWLAGIEPESLILAQSERWRHA